MVTITVSGTPGSGKSTIAHLLHEKLGIKYVNSGMLFREAAKNYKLSLAEFGKYCEKNRQIDKELDERQIEILKKGNVILEGRLAGWLAFKNDISSFKIMIDADVNTRIERVVNREKGNFDKRKKEIIEREKSEKTRYKNYYGIDLGNISIYDLVIDSSNKKPEEIIDIILEKLGK
jgi:CMP/dCMP kinase